MSEVKVNLGERSYVVTIGQRKLGDVGPVVARVSVPSAVAVVTNRTVARLYGSSVMDSLRSAGVPAELVILPSGERFKTLATVARVYERLLDVRIDRAGAIVALGGGVVGDIAGFAAASYMRGIDYYQVPTTLLAQVDSSIGGKTGVDLSRGKNLVGAFHQPRAVIIDINTLRTLPGREIRCGLAEIVKHGIIYDSEFCRFLEDRAADLQSKEPDSLEGAIGRSVEIKRDVVERDERESGVRAILNYGHTIGHAVEAATGYGKYRHGEAVSIGMVTEALLAEQIGVARKGLASEVAALVSQLGLPWRMDDLLATEELLSTIELDKKAVGGTLRFALPSRLGECGVHAVDRDTVAAAIESHRALTFG